MMLANKYVLGAGGLLLVLAAVWGYGRYQYGRGESDAKAEAVLQQIAIEQGMQYERDRADAQYRGAVLARNAALADLSDVRGKLDGLLADARNGKTAGASFRPDDTGPDWIGGFAACYAEYDELARDAAGWADQVNGLQGYIRALTPK